MKLRKTVKQTLAMAALLADIGKRYTALVTRLSRMAEEAESLEYDLVQVAGWCKNAGLPVSAPLLDRERKRDEAVTVALPQAAHVGVGSLKVEPLADGRYSVQINGGNAFDLPPMLGKLLLCLSDDGARPKDDSGPLVAWKSYAEVQLQLWDGTGRSYSKHAVCQLVCRLRKKLEEHGYNRYLIQTDRLGGMLRFALRRQGAMEEAPYREPQGEGQRLELAT